jgi:hypothetical protein
VSTVAAGAPFVHLRVHTEYSLVDSVVRVPALVTAVAAAGMPAVAVTDECNLFAMVKFYRAALAAGVKPVVGADLLVRESGERAQPVRLTLLCQNARGYGNITRLVSRAYREGRRQGVPLLEREWLDRDACDGLIALSGATQGDIGRAFAAGREVEAALCLDQWLALFGDRFYIERAVACRWSPPTTCVSCHRTISSRTRHGSASRTARCSPIRGAPVATRRSNRCARLPRWCACSRTYRRRWRTASRSHVAAACR